MFVFPWTNLHELNLDWILAQVKQFAELIPPMSTAVEDVQALQTDVEQAVEDANQAVEDAQAAIETAEEAKEIAEQAAQGTIADGAVTTVKLDDEAVTTAKIADGAVTGAKIASGTIQTGNLSSGCVTTTQILDGTISPDDLGVECVTSSKLGAAAVTTAKIDDGAVTSAKLGAGAVTNAKIADEAVTSVKLESTIANKISAIGQYEDSTSVTTSVPPTTVTSLRTLTLGAGNWVISGYFNFATGFSNKAYGYLLANGSTFAQINGTGEGGGAFSLCAVLNISSPNTTISLSAYHQASTAQTTSASVLRAVRIA